VSQENLLSLALVAVVLGSRCYLYVQLDEWLLTLQESYLVTADITFYSNVCLKFNIKQFPVF
jgi:hypothetical protein